MLNQGKAKFDLGRLMVAIAERVCSKSKQDIVLEKEDLDGKLFVFAGSQLLLETAFELLIENARTAIERSGQPGRIELKGTFDTNWFMLSIQDTGHGIPSEIRSSFYQQPVASNTGFGYGSYVAANILRAQGGDILLADTGPQGTRIELRLPRAWEKNYVEDFNE